MSQVDFPIYIFHFFTDMRHDTYGHLATIKKSEPIRRKVSQTNASDIALHDQFPNSFLSPGINLRRSWVGAQLRKSTRFLDT